MGLCQLETSLPLVGETGFSVFWSGLGSFFKPPNTLTSNPVAPDISARTGMFAAQSLRHATENACGAITRDPPDMRDHLCINAICLLSFQKDVVERLFQILDVLSYRNRVLPDRRQVDVHF
jgi:hypothetical protein